MQRSTLFLKLALAVALLTATMTLTPAPASADPPWCVQCWFNSSCHTMNCKCDALGGAIVQCEQCADNDYSCTCGPGL